MKKSKFVFIYMIFMIIVCSIYSLSVQANEKKEKISVFVSILPQQYFVKQIGKYRVSVNVLVLPGKSPATYAPNPEQMGKLAKAALYFRIGVPFENILISRIGILKGGPKIIDTRHGIQLRKLKAHHHHEEEEVHDHNDEEDGHHEGKKDHAEEGGNDPHIWLSPLLVKQQAKTIYAALVKIDPSEKKYYQDNYNKFINELDTLHRKITRILLPYKGRTVFVFHPAFGYFADAYGLEQIAVEMEGKAPKGKDLSLFIKKAKKENARVIFVQPQFNRHAAMKIARAVNGIVISIDPLSENYIKALEKIADRIAKNL